MRTLTAALALVLLAFALPAAAQDLPQPERMGAVDWYIVGLVKFKPGTREAAREIIYEHFIKADDTAGRDPIPFEFITGEWDHVVFFPMKGGVADLEWETRPIDAEWWAALAEIEGGARPAKDLVARFSEMIERQETHIVYRRRR